ncbi:ATP-grasp domain-containing protein [Streptacidiphilus sp. P02-A3a]|uniref:ATP-grasp domain-containing protein n=1 Tax=Streptacidiphilus sp. P02-A3a TaxID=2704468 RepID=UPI0015FC3850|nr:ATP-grasp domain-containing protein [Streptacidiphilus sp. P02-A3a]QMU71318.1 ATP-grasp domain-containing protein [Streptacidiphilus sp. P02-A3a]
MNDLTPSGVAAPTRVLVVEPVSSGSRVVSDAHALGFTVTVVSADEGERTLPPALRELVDTLLIVDTNDEQALTDCVLAHHAAAPLAAVVPGGEFTIPAVTRINSRLGLPGLPSAAVDWVRNKASMRTRVAEAGLRVPRFALAGTVAEVEAAAAVVGFPCVLKPVESSGSIHVSRADSLGELLTAYQELTADRRLDLGIALDSRVLLEEYVAGPEFSADGHVHEGRVTILSLTRKLLGPEPYFVELGHVVPSSVPEPVAEQVAEYVAGIVDAVRLTAGPFHCELRLSDEGPVLMEIAARLPGDRITELVQRATGASMSRIMLAAYLGRAPEELSAFGAAEAKCAGIRYFTAPDLDRYTEIKGWDEISARPEVVETGVVIQPGEEIPPLRDFRGRIGYALFTADSAERALELWQELGDSVAIV